MLGSGTEAIATTQAVILDRVRDRLIAACDAITASLIHVSDDPEPPPGWDGELVVIVSQGDGVFPAEHPIGAGADELHEQATVSVQIFKRSWIDRHGEYEKSLTDANASAPGLLLMKHQILKALAGHALLDESGNLLVTEYIRPASSNAPMRDRYRQQGKPRADLQLVFETNFVWDLS